MPDNAFGADAAIPISHLVDFGAYSAFFLEDTAGLKRSARPAQVR
ncbi:hypothetical protein [Mycobacterium sp. 1245801.1]|nr:hypothetical protein [Mycobacterium sp. 1245801.1]